ncbi:unnamed protein product, partial [Polarella glacialis]
VRAGSKWRAGVSRGSPKGDSSMEGGAKTCHACAEWSGEESALGYGRPSPRGHERRPRGSECVSLQRRHERLRERRPLAAGLGRFGFDATEE